MDWIVVQLDPGANFYVRIALAEPLDFIERNSSAIPVVIGERDIAQPALARTVYPRLQKLLRIRLHAMPLWM
jgi:hypothetical protein